MIKYENQCVGCPPEMGCLGSSCRYINVPIYCCDECGVDDAIVHIEDRDLCENCARNFYSDVFSDLTLYEMSEMFDDIDFKILD